MCGKGKNVNMGTRIRPELSEKNKYWISRHRYYELKHFCLQYPTWKKIYVALDDLIVSSPLLEEIAVSNNIHGDPTAKYAVVKAHYAERINMIENAAKESDSELANYILKAVTEELSYTYLKTRLEIPCSKDTYYDRYRKFFWLLDKARK